MKKDGSDDDYDIDDDDDDDVVIISSEMMSAEESEDEKEPDEVCKNVYFGLICFYTFIKLSSMLVNSYTNSELQMY